jgi:hypothetical protein
MDHFKLWASKIKLAITCYGFGYKWSAKHSRAAPLRCAEAEVT